jgi:ubiquinone/menaquinone biosynthesis C-methylase UbiE
MGTNAQLKAAHRGMWSLGDYHRFATSTIWQLGPVLVEACGIGPGQRVLDVAAGTGNVAIRAAKAGARVVASDLTPENFDAGRRAAAAEGVDLEWREADAAALPFGDASFDVVTSCFGAIFAPDHQAVAGELMRVCRPGGTIGLTTFVPDGAGGDFFTTLGKYAPPPPPGSASPLLWGDRDHVRALFGERVRSLELQQQEYVESAPSARDYFELFLNTFGPTIAIRGDLADAREREAFDRDLQAFIERWNRGAPGAPVEIPYRYLPLVARP